MASYMAIDGQSTRLTSLLQMSCCSFVVRDGSDLRVVVGSARAIDISCETAMAPFRAPGAILSATVMPPDLSLLRTIPAVYNAPGPVEITLVEG